ncbi:2-phospho-L-lactate guanylyltransferase [Halobaculum sp. MBLA0143]|uniref:2-phospho-L-lactate guanylyltransferase n=1 Tax=Halobaculum sp. MBLA0143 TaxID=3079933 RepID=UPI003523CFDD
MEALVPFAADRPKTRLADVLSSAERRSFAAAMLTDVLAAVRGAGHTPVVVTTAPLERDAAQVVDERPLGEAVDGLLAAREPDHDSPLAVVMADLALATPSALTRLTAPPDDGPADLVFAPGLGGGTNAVVVRDARFRTDYHGVSIGDHRALARELGASVREVDSRLLATDVDTPADLAELLVHGDGAARDWLEDAGFELDTSGGRVTVDR